VFWGVWYRVESWKTLFECGDVVPVDKVSSHRCGVDGGVVNVGYSQEETGTTNDMIYSQPSFPRRLSITGQLQTRVRPYHPPTLESTWVDADDTSRLVPCVAPLREALLDRRRQSDL
jgi:hypothetical protein